MRLYHPFESIMLSDAPHISVSFAASTLPMITLIYLIALFLTLGQSRHFGILSVF